MHTTNYHDTFIAVAPDCRASTGQTPPSRDPKTAAQIQFEMLAGHPYEFSSDDVVYASNGERRGIPREQFFAKGQPCLRSSALAKRYGWGIHSDSAGRVTIYAVGSPGYARLQADESLTQLAAMRSTRA